MILVILNLTASFSKKALFLHSSRAGMHCMLVSSLSLEDRSTIQKTWDATSGLSILNWREGVLVNGLFLPAL